MIGVIEANAQQKENKMLVLNTCLTRIAKKHDFNI